MRNGSLLNDQHTRCLKKEEKNEMKKEKQSFFHFDMSSDDQGISK
jgi:hypothetical protein